MKSLILPFDLMRTYRLPHGRGLERIGFLNALACIYGELAYDDVGIHQAALCKLAAGLGADGYYRITSRAGQSNPAQ